MVAGKPKSTIAMPECDIWYNKEINLWTAQFKDAEGNQIGNSGFGVTKDEAKNDLLYQNIDIIS